jgi:hypothetical protein
MLGYLALVIAISDNSIVALAAMLLTVLAILRLAWEKLADLVAHIWTDITSGIEAVLDFRERLKRRRSEP